MIRRALRARGISAAIPEKIDQIAARKWRGIATRSDKLAITYPAATVLHVCITWTGI